MIARFQQNQRMVMVVTIAVIVLMLSAILVKNHTQKPANAFSGTWQWNSEDLDQYGEPIASFTLNLSGDKSTLTGTHCTYSASKIDCSNEDTSTPSLHGEIAGTKANLQLTSYRDGSTVLAEIQLNDKGELEWQTTSQPSTSAAYLPDHSILRKK